MDVSDRRLTDDADNITFFVSSAPDDADCFSSFNHTSSTVSLSLCVSRAKKQSGSGLQPCTWYQSRQQHSGAGRQICIPGRHPVLRKWQPATREATHRLGVVSHVIFTTNLEWLVPLFANQSPCIQNICSNCHYCKTWMLSVADTRRLEALHMKCKRHIASIHWQDDIRNTEVAALTGLDPVSESIILRARNQARRGYSGPPGSVVPRRRDPRSSPWSQFKTSSRPPQKQLMVRSTSHGQQNSTCWSLETSLVTWSPTTIGSEATILALTTMASY